MTGNHNNAVYHECMAKTCTQITMRPEFLNFNKPCRNNAIKYFGTGESKKANVGDEER